MAKLTTSMTVSLRDMEYLLSGLCAIHLRWIAFDRLSPQALEAIAVSTQLRAQNSHEDRLKDESDHQFH